MKNIVVLIVLACATLPAQAPDKERVDKALEITHGDFLKLLNTFYICGNVDGAAKTLRAEGHDELAAKAEALGKGTCEPVREFIDLTK